MSKKKLRDEKLAAQTPCLQLIFLGDKKVGKTKLIERMKGEEFNHNYFPTRILNFLFFFLQFLTLIPTQNQSEEKKANLEK